MDYQFQEVKLSDLSSLEHGVFVTKSLRVAYANILVVKFTGKYGIGSAGNLDASFMCAMIEASLVAWCPSALILDFSELIYVWGDTMESVLSAGESLNISPVTIVGNDCKEAIRTLYFGVESQKTLSEGEHIFESQDEAFAFVEEQLLKKCDTFNQTLTS